MHTRYSVRALAIVCAVSFSAASGSDAVLWQTPGETTLDDWTWGPGGETRAPRGPFEFLDEDLKGTNPKIKVRDIKGDEWIVKFGGESHSDVFASRLLNVSGYVTAPTYFVASGVITGVHDLRRAKPFLDKNGAFRDARFKLHNPKTFVRVKNQNWAWNDNPFIGTPEFNGLKILMMLTSNWDAKDGRDGEGSNTGVFSQAGSSGDKLFYAFDDWGATMGKWGNFFERDKWDPDGYRRQTGNFVRVMGPRIEWGYRGKHDKDITAGISAEDIGWVLTYLSRITDEQLRAGLRASGATPPAIDIFAQSIRERISQLQRASAAADTVAALPPLTLRFTPACRASQWRQ